MAPTRGSTRTRLAAALFVLAAAAGAPLALGWLPLVPGLGAPLLLAGLAAWTALRPRMEPGLRLPWLAVVVVLGAGAADLVGVGTYLVGASLVVGLLLALAQAVDARLPA